MIECFLAGSLNGCETIGGNASEYGDHLSIAIIDALQSLTDLLHRGWQNPFAEGSAVAQGTGFASKDRDIVPGIIDGIATAEAASVFRDRQSILFDDDSISIGMNLDWRPTAVDRTEYLLLSKRTVHVFDTEAGTLWKPSNGPT